MKTNLQTKGNEMNINDLNWQEHPAGFGGTQAKIFYLNGYGVSIFLDSMFYSNGIDTYEVAILEGTEDDWEITYNTPITDDIPSARVTARVFIATGKNGRTARTINMASTNPVKPPNNERTTDSVRN